MKRYEDFNRMFNKNDPAEVQAVEIMLCKIADKFGIEENLSPFIMDFKIALDWLSEEVI